MSKQEDLTKVSIITVIAMVILVSTLFWLKGYKFHSQKTIKVFFSDVSGLEEGSPVRWSGLRVGVVESINPVLVPEPKNGSKKNNKNKYFDLAEKYKQEINTLQKKLVQEKDPKEKESLNEKFEDLKEMMEVHAKQGEAYEEEKRKTSASHVEVGIVITKKNVPLGPLSRVSIVPSGLIGDHFVEITPVINRKQISENFETVFFTKEPLRFERLLKANIESSEAFKDAIEKVNQLLKDEDITLLRETIQDARSVVVEVNMLVGNASVLLATTSEKLEQLASSSTQLSASVVQVGSNINEIIGDEEIREDLKETSASINKITSEIAKLLDEEGLTEDILEISQSAKITSTEVSSLVKDLRQTHNELELPKTISNLNSLAEKLDKLTGELNNVVTDDEFKEDLKVTVEKARETSENLQKISKKLNKRFLLFRLLF